VDDFVELCREEWRRLRVPDSLADEMAAELAADLAAAAADGVPAEEFLGPAAADPREFARAWAVERGVVPAPGPEVRPARRRPVVLALFTVVSAAVLVLAALALITGQPQMSIVAARSSGPGIVRAVHVSAHANAAAPVEWVLLVLALLALAFAAWLWTGRGRPNPPHVSA
jgi:hypothetical protein